MWWLGEVRRAQVSELSLYLLAYVVLLGSGLVILRVIVRREYRNGWEL